MGEVMLEKLRALESSPIVGDVRGKGLLIGVEFVADKTTRIPFDPAKKVTAMVVEAALERGILVMPGAPGMVDGVAGDHIAISPPFTITEDQVDEVVRVLKESVDEVANRVS
tara:strand:+ start:15 stop:350 length:336 start_codon:yes stop_codon:yes gene_type:complete